MEATRRPGQELACGWCGQSISLRSRGRVPKWCSDNCRHRAWEQNRAATSGRCAVQIIDRKVEIAVPVEVEKPVEIEVVPKGAAWAPALQQLAKQLDTGRIYDRDLDQLATALTTVLDAFERRTNYRRRH